jgi:hypothetical protein
MKKLIVVGFFLMGLSFFIPAKSILRSEMMTAAKYGAGK